MQNESLDIHYQNDNPHDTFRKRLLKALKNKNMSQRKLAELLNYTPHAITNYTKENGIIPPLDTLKKISVILDVDVAYLLGEINCPHWESEKISKVVGLSEESSEKIIRLKSGQKEMLDKIISHTDFVKLLSNAYTFTHSQNQFIRISDISMQEINHCTEDDAVSELYESILLGIFRDILWDVYDDYVPQMITIRLATYIEVFFKLMDAKMECEKSYPPKIKIGKTEHIIDHTFYERKEERIKELDIDIDKVVDSILSYKEEFREEIKEHNPDLLDSLPDDKSLFEDYYHRIKG